MKNRVLSGMRPTGKLHLGHLLGALNNWAQLQDEYECFFMVADWHGLMSEYHDPSRIRKDTIECVIDWISCGIDPQKSTIFVQSDVKEHAEFHLLLSIVTPLTWLERCPTYKEQLRELKTKDITTYGFLGYPVLQASDILIYKAGFVPVGSDQLPHLELTREIARRFNSLYKDIFPEPQPILTEVPKLLGLDRRKMSKSFENYIALSDPPGLIRKKTQSMFTDPKRIKLSDPGHPKTCNVYSYYKAFREELTEEVRDYCKKAKVGCTECKRRLAEILIARLSPIREKRRPLLKNKDLIKGILDEGAREARDIASKTMEEVRKIIGLAR